MDVGCGVIESMGLLLMHSRTPVSFPIFLFNSVLLRPWFFSFLLLVPPLPFFFAIACILCRARPLSGIAPVGFCNREFDS